MFGWKEILILLVIFLLFLPVILIYGHISKKAGFSWWLGLLMCIPLVNVVVIWVFAFTEWPVTVRKNGF